MSSHHASRLASALRHPAPVVALLLFAAALSPAVGEELPKIVLDQLETVKPAVDKAYAEYSKKVGDENAKLISVIQKAMEKATKAGKLDDALALRGALEKAKSGELIKQILNPGPVDMLGNPLTPAAGPESATGEIAVITLSTADPVEILAFNKPIYNNRDFLISDVSKELQGLSFAQRGFKEPAACTLKVVKPGILYVAVGVPNDGVEFEKQGFAKTDLKISAPAGPQAIVKKVVHAGETVQLGATATANSFPIWKGK